jgi:hypothetical protein
MRRFTSCLVVLTLVTVAACASTSGSASRWPFTVRGQLADADIQAIIAVVNHSGPDVAKHIRLIDVKNTNKVEVITFNIPDNAAGNIIVVLKQRGRWIQDKEHLGVWMKHF